MSESAVSDAVRERVEVASKQINAVLIWTVGMFCIMCWDWLSTLPQEITNIWRQKFTPTSYLYLLNRYYGLLQFVLVIPLLSGAFTGESCDNFFQWQNVGAMLSTMIVQPILALRVASLYNHHIALLVVFGLFYVAEFALMVTWLAMAWIWHPVPQAPWPCLAIEPHDWVLVVFSMHLVAYVLLLGLFIGRPQCFKAPLQSGLLSFAAIAAMNLVNVVILAATVPSLQWVNVPATIMLNIVMSCKLVLDEPWRAPESRSPYSSVKPPRFPSQATGTTAASGSKRNSGRMIRKWGVLSKIEETSVETSGSEDRV